MSKLSKKNSYKIKKRIQNKKGYTIKNKHSGGAFGRVSDSPLQRIGNAVGRISQSAPQMSNIAKRTLNQTRRLGEQGAKTVLPIIEKGVVGAYNITKEGVDALVKVIKESLKKHEYEFENNSKFENIKLSQPKISKDGLLFTILEVPDDIYICRKNKNVEDEEGSVGGGECNNKTELQKGDFIFYETRVGVMQSQEELSLKDISTDITEFVIYKQRLVKKLFDNLHNSFTNEEGVGRKVIVGIASTSKTVLGKTVELSQNAVANLSQSVRESLKKHTYVFEDFSNINKEQLTLKKTKEYENGTYFKVVSGFVNINICEKPEYLQDSFNVDDQKPEYLQDSFNGGGEKPTCENQKNLEKGDILYFEGLKINDKDEHSLSDLLDSGLPETNISVFKKSQFKEAIKTLGNFLLSSGKTLGKGAISGVKTVASKLTRKRKNSNNKPKQKSRKFGLHLPGFRRRTKNNSTIENNSDQPEQNDGSRNNNISSRTNNNSGNGVNTNINRPNPAYGMISNVQPQEENESNHIYEEIPNGKNRNNRNNRNKRSKFRRAVTSGLKKIGSSTKKGFAKLIPEKKLYVNVLQYDFGNETDPSTISTKEKELHDMILKFCGNRNEITALFVRNYNNHNQTSIMNTEKVYFNSDSDPTTNNRQYALKIVASSNFSVEEEQNDIMGLVIKVSKNNKFVNFELSNDNDSVSNTVINTVRVNRISGAFESNIKEQNKLDVQLNDNQYKRYSINSPNKDGVGDALRGLGAVGSLF